MFLPQYNPYQRQEDPVAELAVGALLWMLLILLGLFLLCAWLTKLFFRHVLNPQLNGALDREDGLVVVWSVLIWAMIAGIASLPGLLPLITVATFTEVLTALLSVIGAGIAWGAAIGAFLVIQLWLEVEERWEPTHGFAQITQLPADHYLPTPEEPLEQPALSLDEVEALMVQTAWQDTAEAIPVGRDGQAVEVQARVGVNGKEPVSG